MTPEQLKTLRKAAEEALNRNGTVHPSVFISLLDYVESLERDAARYRWLRDATGETPLRPAAFNSEFCPDQRLKFDFPTLVSFDCIGNQIDLDAAIDAAMGESK